MKNSSKRVIAAAMAAMIMALSSAASVFAAATTAPATARPRPGSSGSTTTTKTTSGDTNSSSSRTTKSTSDSSDDNSSPKATQSTSGNSDTSDTGSDSQTSTTTSKTKTTASPIEETPEPTTAVETASPQSGNESKGVSKGGMFLWFLLSVIVNGIISFAIGNRFYKISRRESHVTSEIRALRRDVEEKFVGNVGGFAESEFDVSNSNEDYSMDEEGIRMTPASSQPRSAEADDMFKKWEEQRAQRRAALKRTVETAPEFEDEDDDVKVYSPSKKHKKKYQPKRTAIIEDEDDEDLYEEDIKGSGFDAVKGKAKEFLGDIFPFKED